MDFLSRTGKGVVNLVILLCCWGLICPFQLQAGDPMLPEAYSGQVDISGWYMSEKLDGVRGCWDGRRLWSKNGRLFYPPAEFTRDLPPFPVEGELWAGRGKFAQTVAIVSKEQPHEGWLQLQLAIFDVPEAPGGFLERIAVAKEWFAGHPSANAFVICQKKIDNPEQLRQHLARIEQLGGEGLIVRNPDAHYIAGRSSDILKVKSFQDSEAVVIAHLPGKGRNAGRLGALLVELDDGRQCRIGTGFTDAERESPPPVGTVITFRYSGRYPSGLPRFPSYVRVRLDHSL